MWPILVAAVLLLTGAVPPSVAGPLTQPRCPGASQPWTFASGLGLLENLAFDGAGGLFVSGERGLRRLGTDGSSIALDGDVGGGLAFGPDGRLHAGVGNSPVSGVAGSGDADVVRYSTIDPPTRDVFASGLDMVNGVAFGPSGELFVSNDFGRYVALVAPGGGAGSAWARVDSANGLVVAPPFLYAAVTFDGASPIVRVRLDDPSDVRVIANLSFGAASLAGGVHAPSESSLPLIPKGLDDMAWGADGRLYVAANGAGEVLRVDPSTGSACVLASGLVNPSSVRFAHGFGTFDGLVFVTSFDGSVRVVRT